MTRVVYEQIDCNTCAGREIGTAALALSEAQDEIERLQTEVAEWKAAWVCVYKTLTALRETLKEK